MLMMMMIIIPARRLKIAHRNNNKIGKKTHTKKGKWKKEEKKGN